MYLLSFLLCAKYTTVCDQIANKSFVILNASISAAYREKPFLRSASHARRQDSVTGGRGHKQIFRGGGTNSLILRIREYGPKKKGLHLELCADFHEFWGEEKKKVFISKNAQIFTNSGVKPQKKSLYYKICKKQFLLTNSGVITSILGVSGLELHFSGTEPVTFFWEQFSLGGHNSCLGGTSSDLGGGTAPECIPWRRACCQITAIYRTVTITFSLQRCCSKSVLLKK